MYTAIHASCSSRSRTVQGESTNSRPRRRVSHDITYKKRGWALRDHDAGRQRSAEAKEVEEAKQAESFQQKYSTAPFRLGFYSPGQVAYNLVDVGFRIYPGTWLAALVLAATAGLAAQAHNPLQNFAHASPAHVVPKRDRK